MSSEPSAAFAGSVRSPSAETDLLLRQGRTVVLLRWVLIVATSYLVVFGRPNDEGGVAAALFVACYLASNILLGALLPQLRSTRALGTIIVITDTFAVTLAHVLSGSASDASFVLYFLVVFLSALTEQIALVVGAAFIIGGVHLYTLSRFMPFEQIVDAGGLLRVPFLFAVALLFGYLAQEARRSARLLEERRARAARLEFLSAVSHDLKNPLYVIQSLAELLLSDDGGQLTTSQRDLTNRIHVAARQVTTFALNLIDAERIEAGRLALRREEITLGQVIGEALLLARSASELKGVEITCSLPDDLPTVFVDPMQTERVLSNLLANAIKFTPAGGRVSVHLAPRGESVVLEVADSGPGIPPAQLPYVFEKYQRGLGDNRMEGSGLGMFIVRAIVEAQGGKVSLSTPAAGGTAVRVSFPTAASLRGRERSREASLAAARPVLARGSA